MRTPLIMMLTAAIGAATLPAAASAQPGRVLSGTDGAPLPAASRSRQVAGQGDCYGYITGVMDQLALQGAICVPVQFDQVIAVARSHLAASGPDIKKHATFLIGRVLRAAYPCQR